jgi:hypothetical protein
MARIHRIYTEKRNQRAIIRLVAEEFESFTIQPTLGYYRGKPEKPIVLEIVGGNALQIKRLAERIRKMNGQKSIMILTHQAHSESQRD